MRLPAKQIQDLELPYERLVITGRIVIPRALHIGTGQASLLTDAAIRRDREGQPYIPGSTLAGLLRSTAEDFAPHLCSNIDGTIRRLFGRKREDDPRRVDTGASRLLVEDARICESLQLDIEIRDYVGIDRQRAAARPHLKYDREVAPSNTSYAFELSLEEPLTEDARLLLAVLDFWSVCGVQLGARTTTGLGEARIDGESLKFYGLNFKQREILRSFLLDGATDAKYMPDAAEITRATLIAGIDRLGIRPHREPPQDELFLPQHLFITLDLILDEPLLVKGSIPEVPDLPEEDNQSENEPTATERSAPVSGGERLSSAPRTSDAEFITALELRDGSLKPGFYIPGSTLKGVLRARAEKIIRTLNLYRRHADVGAAEADPDAERDYEPRIAACAVTHADDLNPRLKACFGDGNRQRTAQRYERWNRQKSGNNRARDRYDRSCLTCRIFGNTIMRGRLTCTEAVPKRTLTPKLFDHVAIDRFTGGAADEKKFDTRPLMPVIEGDRTVEAFTFKIHIERPELWMLGLLGHLLKDLNSGDIRIGHATRRGYGRVRAQVTEATLLALSGSGLFNTCRTADLNVETDFGAYGPYREVNLSDDWKRIFSSITWGVAGPDRSLQDTPGGLLLAQADEAFQSYVKEAEQHSERENFGEFHDNANPNGR